MAAPKKKTRNACPKCGARSIPFLYGEPSRDLFEAGERGELVIGGCCITEESPSRRCTACAHEFGRVRL